VLIHTLAEKGLLNALPRWLPDNTCFLSEVGSTAYGVVSSSSDRDIQGFCLPPKDEVFGHLAGHIDGFGPPFEPFAQWFQHHIPDPDGRDRTYDLTVWSVVRFCHLSMSGNPNTLDVLFAPRRCIIHTTALANHLRDNRHIFLSKEVMVKLRGYAARQMHKIMNGSNSSNPTRAADIAKTGMDTKFAYHVVRLCLQAEQVLEEHDLDLERNSELLNAVRRGEWTPERLAEWFEKKEISLEESYGRSTLRAKADQGEVRNVLMQMLEMHYGNLDAVVSKEHTASGLVRDIEAVLDRYR